MTDRPTDDDALVGAALRAAAELLRLSDERDALKARIRELEADLNTAIIRGDQWRADAVAAELDVKRLTALGNALADAARSTSVAYTGAGASALDAALDAWENR